MAMQANISAITAALILPAAIVVAQTEDKADRNVPIYQVTVIQRTVKAINYEYRSGPTGIDFTGTVLLPHSKGDAIVESKQGRTEIEAHIEGLKSPQQFGRDYLTYVLWAITPDGRPHNLAEIVPSHSDKATLRATTDLQAFALIVTAEPYSAVRQPSDVVVLENQVRPDTIGTIEEVNAKYDLLRRGPSTVQAPGGAVAPNGPNVSTHEFEALTELYEAQSAVNMAAGAQGDKYAPEIFARAQTMLQNAQQLHASKADYRRVVQSAREAAQTAEDARLIAERRTQEAELQAKAAELSAAQAQLAAAETARKSEAERAQAALATAQEAQAQAADAQAEADRRAREAAEAQARAAQESAARARVEAQSKAPSVTDQRQRTLRATLLVTLKQTLPTLDTGRGLVVTLPDSAFRGGALRDEFSKPVMQVAATLAAQPGLHVAVQGYSDRGDQESVCQERADSVRRILEMAGMGRGTVSAEALGDSRPLTSNSTEQGRLQNRRVEMVISGAPIGNLPTWEHPQTLTGALNSTRQ